MNDAYFQEWRDSQAKILDEIETYFAPMPVKRVPLFTHEVLGRERLEELARVALRRAGGSGRRHPHRGALHVHQGDGHYEVRLQLPFAVKGEIGLFKKGDELVVEIGTLRRHIGLPTSMAGPFARQAQSWRIRS